MKPSHATARVDTHAHHNAPAAQTMAQTIMEQMQAVIEHHQFRVMKLYPNDLEFDRIILDKCAVEGASIAWAVGDIHTHLVVLGLEPEQNEMVTCFTNLSAKDKFYLIQVSKGGVTFTEKARSEFSALASHPIPYTSSGGTSDFVMKKRGDRLAHCTVSKTGTFEKPLYQVVITAYQNLSPLDTAAVEYWCHRAVSVASGSLFTGRDLIWRNTPKSVATEQFALTA